MNKAELIEAIAQEVDLTRVQVNEALNAFMDTVVRTLSAGEKVTLADFGTFLPVERAPKKGRNPQTGESLHIPGKMAAKFKPGKGLAKAVES